MTISEKVAHLKGVMEGMNYDASTNDGKLISLIVDVLADMSDEIDVITEDVDTLFDYCDELDEDLGEVEEVLFECDDCECDCDECDCDDIAKDFAETVAEVTKKEINPTEEN